MSSATIFQIHLALGYVHAVPPDLDVHLIVDNYSTQKHPKARFAKSSNFARWILASFSASSYFWSLASAGRLVVLVCYSWLNNLLVECG